MFLFNFYISNFTKIRHTKKNHYSRVSHSKVPRKESKNTLQTVENSEKKVPHNKTKNKNWVQMWSNFIPKNISENFGEAFLKEYSFKNFLRSFKIC
jgi:hypothetical protein